MDAFNKLSGKTDSSANKTGEKLSSDLKSSAKVVADATQSAYNNVADKVDTGKVASAAGDLVGAARDYGKLAQEGVGKYVKQAGDYVTK